MELILSNFSASISELKKNPTALLKQAGGTPIAILNHNRPTAYLVPADVYEAIVDALEDHELGQIIRERKSQYDQAVEVNIDDL
jgi:antitoxin StbD